MLDSTLSIWLIFKPITITVLFRIINCLTRYESSWKTFTKSSHSVKIKQTTNLDFADNILQRYPQNQKKKVKEKLVVIPNLEEDLYLAYNHVQDLHELVGYWNSYLIPSHSQSDQSNPLIHQLIFETKLLTALDKDLFPGPLVIEKHPWKTHSFLSLLRQIVLILHCFGKLPPLYLKFEEIDKLDLESATKQLLKENPSSVLMISFCKSLNSLKKSISTLYYFNIQLNK